MTGIAVQPAHSGSSLTTPHVTVALCTWNGARWLPELLDSLEGQIRRPDELVIQDDASTDGTVELIEDFATRSSFPVHLQVNERRLGSTANFERVLKRCSGRIVALADQDDIWYPVKLHRLVGHLEGDPILTLVFSDADLLGPDGQPSGRELWRSRGNSRYLTSHEIVPGEMFARRALSTGCTMAVRRRAIDAALPFPPSLDDPIAPMRHDRWLSLVASAVGTVRAIPEPLLGFRVHGGQQTGVLDRRELRRRQMATAVRAAWGPLRPETAAEHRARAVQLGEAADRADRLGDFGEADTLRAVANHHLTRAAPGASPWARLRSIGSELRRGGYDRSWLGAGAAAADAVRALRDTA